jgi:hypothetical protein
VSDGWSFGGSILTFVFPMLLFIGVAVALYVLFTKPAAVPGRRSSSTTEHPVSYTPIPGTVTPTGAPGNPAPAPGNPAPAPCNSAADDDTRAASGENAAPEAQK